MMNSVHLKSLSILDKCRGKNLKLLLCVIKKVLAVQMFSYLDCICTDGVCVVAT